MAAIEQVSATVGVTLACRALGICRAALYRRRHPRPPAPPPHWAPPARALSASERDTVLATRHAARFADQSPAEVYATLLDEGTYLCSIRTMYRLLAGAGEVRERRNQLRHRRYLPPVLEATGPNQVWSWDITKLLGPVKWTYFYLYVLLDIFSRYVVGWMVAREESASLAERLIDESCAKQGIQPGQLTIHADRGPAMTSKPVALLLADLGVIRRRASRVRATARPRPGRTVAVGAEGVAPLLMARQPTEVASRGVEIGEGAVPFGSAKNRAGRRDSRSGRNPGAGHWRLTRGSPSPFARVT